MQRVCAVRRGSRVMRRRDGCWRWRWCWRADRVQRRRRWPAWTASGSRDWVHRTNAEGLAGLSDRQGAVGPKRRLSPEQEAEVAEWDRRGPDWAEHGVVRWRRADLARAIEARFGVVLAEREPGARCCGGSASGDGWHGLAIPARMLRRSRLSGRLRRPHRRAAAGARPRAEPLELWWQE
jgi:hypothetical protein